MEFPTTLTANEELPAMYLSPTVYVYWIHLYAHKNILVEGYVGISINPKQRLKQHLGNSKSHLAERLKPLEEEIVLDTIYSGTREECMLLEKKLRPSPHIGWNRAAGGAASASEALRGIKKSTPVWNKGKKPSEEQITKFKDTWETKRADGYISPNKGVSVSSSKKGKKGPPMPLKTRNALLRSNTGRTPSNVDILLKCITKTWKITDTYTGEITEVYGLKQWAISKGFNYGSVYNTLARGGRYKHFLIEKVI